MYAFWVCKPANSILFDRRGPTRVFFYFVDGKNKTKNTPLGPFWCFVRPKPGLQGLIWAYLGGGSILGLFWNILGIPGVKFDIFGLCFGVGHILAHIEGSKGRFWPLTYFLGI